MNNLVKHDEIKCVRKKGMCRNHGNRFPHVFSYTAYLACIRRTNEDALSAPSF